MPPWPPPSRSASASSTGAATPTRSSRRSGRSCAPMFENFRGNAQCLPSKGARRVFLIDHVDRAGEQAANSLLKTLEEPPEHLILILTAENAYDLLPTIRSRAAPIVFTPLPEAEMEAFASSRN